MSYRIFSIKYRGVGGGDLRLCPVLPDVNLNLAFIRGPAFI